MAVTRGSLPVGLVLKTSFSGQVLPGFKRTSLRKLSEAQGLSAYIEAFGSEIMPCTRCFRQGLSCKVVSDRSNRCSNCVDAKVVCDGAGVASFLAKNIRERKRLEGEEAEAEAALEEAMAKLARIRKQKRLLKARGDEAFERGLRALEESGELREESSAVVEAHSFGAIDLIDWNAVGLDEPVLGVVGGSPSEGVVHQ
ncbi:hypothetical protein LRP88_00600 [Fusarium phalaenopsidis]